MLTAQSLTLQRGTKILFQDANFTIYARQKVGVVGRNGCGKSSFFTLLRGELQPDAGNIYLQSNLSVAYLAQEIPNTTMSALRYVMQGDSEIATLLQKLDELDERNKLDELNASKNYDAISLIHNQLYERGGYDLEARAAKILNGLGFPQETHTKAVNSFSGGWRMRLNLAQILLSNADLLLLDEPTNYLDMDAIVWLERWLQNYNGTLLLISHDREFLDNVITKTMYIGNEKIELYTGNYSSFEEQRAIHLEQERSLYAKQQDKVEHLTKYIDRFRAKASKARQAQSRLKMLEKMERVTLTQIDSPFSFRFTTMTNCASPIVKFKTVDFNYGALRVLHEVNFTLDQQDRIGVLGLNGAGKSTFMKLLAGKLQSNFERAAHENEEIANTIKNAKDTEIAGTIYRHKNLNIGYFAQHQVDQLKLHESAIAHLLQIDPSITEQKARTFLGGFGFRGDMAFGAIEHFSGGEKARLVLALIVWQKPNLLLLDEPTNHLDLDMREALAYALQDYAGALVLIAHDRYLLKATVDEFYLVHGQKVNKFDGDMDDYQRWLMDTKKQSNAESTEIKGAAAKRSAKTKTTNTANATNETETKERAPQKLALQFKQAESKPLSKLESKLKKLSAKKEKLTALLQEQEARAPEDWEKLGEYTRQISAIDHEVKAAEDEWFSAYGE